MDLIDRMTQGTRPVLTIDGPRGPRHKVKGGVIYLAREGQASIVPATVVCQTSWVFEKSWDKFKLPRFFSKIKIIYGPAIKIDQDTRGKKFAEAKLEVANALTKLHQENMP